MKRKHTSKSLVLAGLLLIAFISSCTKIEQPELDGKPLQRPVNIVIVK